MNNIINYFYSSQKKSQQIVPPITSPIVQTTKPIKQKTNIVYVVLNKSNQVLGVFDTLELAKKNGKNSTYHNCIIYKFTVNNKCTFLSDPVFEDN
jgi:hypothetical protein